MPPRTRRGKQIQLTLSYLMVGIVQWLCNTEPNENCGEWDRCCPGKTGERMEPSEHVVDLTKYWFDELISPGAVKAAEVAERCSVVQRSGFL